MKRSHTLVVLGLLLASILSACSAAGAASNPEPQPSASGAPGQQADARGNEAPGSAGQAIVTFLVPTVT